MKLVKRPIVFISISLMLGIAVGRYISSLEYIALLLVLIAPVLFLLKKKTDSLLIFILPLVSILGGCLFQYNNQETKYFQEQVVVYGRVEELAYTSNGVQIADVAVDLIETGKESIESDYLVRVYMNEGEQLELGDLVIVSGILNQPQKPANDGGFDNFIYLKTKGYDYSMFSQGTEVRGTSQLTLTQHIGLFREHMSQIYDQIYPLRQAAVVKAMIIGESGSIDTDLRQMYNDSGIAHILAISGLHIGIITGFLVFFFNRMGLNKKKSALGIIAFLWLYALFVGFRASVLRAVIMASVMLLAPVFYRKRDTLSSLGLAAIIILVLNPWQVWDAGFQLSFVSVLTLILFAQKGLDKDAGWKKKAVNLFSAGLWVSITTAPIVAWYFYRVPLLGCFVNLIVIPLVGFAVGFAMLSGIIGLFSIPLAQLLGGGIVCLILQFYELLVGLVVRLPLSTYLLGRPGLLSILLFYIVLIAIYLKRLSVIKTYKPMAIVSIAFFLTVFSNRLFIRTNYVDFLDVGQGDCSILRTYDGKTFVFDTGGYGFIQLGKNTGKTAVIPYLESHGISKIDGLFLSHMDTDHVLGSVELLMEYGVERVYMSDYNWQSKELHRLILLAAEVSDTPVSYMALGDTVDFLNGEIRCLYPYNAKNQPGDDNKGSLVLQLVIGDRKFLYTGDISSAEEEMILNLAVDLESDVLKVAHHGSGYSSTAAFLKAVGMDYSVISRGANNIYGHPAEAVLGNLDDAGALVYDTAINGQITFKTNGTKIKAEPKR